MREEEKVGELMCVMEKVMKEEDKERDLQDY